MIEINQLSFSYGRHEVLRDVNLRLNNGRIYGIYGAAESGKSSFLALLSGALELQGGSVRINGFDLVREPILAKKCLGYLPQALPLYPNMTAFELLSFVAAARGVDVERRFLQVHETLELFGLDSLRNCPISHMAAYSLRKLGLAQAVIGGTEILLLDEPADGLTPKEAADLTERILALADRGKTVFYASSDPAELAAVCDELLLLQDAQLSAPIPTAELLQGRLLRICVSGERSGVLDRLSGISGLLSCKSLPSQEDSTVCFLIRTDNPRAEDDIKLALHMGGYALIGCTEEEPSPAEAELKAGAAGMSPRKARETEELL